MQRNQVSFACSTFLVQSRCLTNLRHWSRGPIGYRQPAVSLVFRFNEGTRVHARAQVWQRFARRNKKTERLLVVYVGMAASTSQKASSLSAYCLGNQTRSLYLSNWLLITFLTVVSFFCCQLCVWCLWWCIGVWILSLRRLQELKVVLHPPLTICLNYSIRQVSNFLTFFSSINRISSDKRPLLSTGTMSLE